MIKTAYEFRLEMEKEGKYQEWASHAVDILTASQFSDMEGRFSAKEAAFTMAVVYQIISDYHSWLSQQLEGETACFVPFIQGD